MSATLTEESERLIVVHIQGTFTFEDLKEVQNKGRDQIDRSGKIRLLILAERFSGWGKEGDWGDLTFMYEYDSHIEKIAIVANEKWVDEILIFVGAGRRQAAVESFPSEEDARNWLRSESE
jgi:hypothetical protein